jgi:hypothetical protein
MAQMPLDEIPLNNLVHEVTNVIALVWLVFVG